MRIVYAEFSGQRLAVCAYSPLLHHHINPDATDCEWMVPGTGDYE